MGPLEWTYAATWSLTAMWCLACVVFRDEFPAPLGERIAALMSGLLTGAAFTAGLWLIFGGPSW